MLHKDLAELLHYTVDSLYGYLPAETFRCLLRHGRLVAWDVARKTGVQKRDVESALVILAQQQLVRYYAVTNVSGSTSTHYVATTYYEASWENAYGQTLRAGRLLRAVEERFGKAAENVILNLLRFGHVSVKDLVGAYGVGEGKETGEGLFVTEDEDHHQTQAHEHRITSVSQLYNILDRLLSAGFIKPVHDILDYWPAQDRQDHIKSTIMAVETRGGKSVKSRQEEYNSEMRKIQYDWQVDSDRFFGNSAMMPEVSDVDCAVTTATRKGDSKSGLDGLILRVNLEKCTVNMRHGFLTRVAERYLGKTTSRVYAAFLQALESKTLRCVDPLLDAAEEDFDDDGHFSIPISAVQVMACLPQEVDLRHGLYHQSLENGYTNGVNGHTSDGEDSEDNRQVNGNHNVYAGDVRDDHREDTNGDLTNGHHNEEEGNGAIGRVQHGLWVGKKRGADALDKDKSRLTNGTHKRPKFADIAMSKSEQVVRDRLLHVEAHLKLLAEDPHGFVKRVGKDWRICMDPLIHACQQAEVENTVTARFGYLAASVVRILYARGNLEEKQLGSLAMTDPKDVRIAVGKLLQAGLIEEIEVPRDTNRSTSKAAYLCSYNPLRARRQLLASTYRTMTRLLQRAETEKAKIGMLVELSERSDVRHNRNLLNNMQRAALKKWEDTEERILVQVARCDELVGLMRDFVREEYIPGVEADADVKGDGDGDSDGEPSEEEEVEDAEDEDAGAGADSD